MNNLFKGAKNMTPEEKKTEKIAMVMMGIIDEWMVGCVIVVMIVVV